MTVRTDEIEKQLDEHEHRLQHLEESVSQLRIDVDANTTALHGSSRLGMAKGLIATVAEIDRKLDNIQVELSNQRQLKAALEQAQEDTWKQFARAGTAIGLLLGALQLASIIIQLYTKLP